MFRFIALAACTVLCLDAALAAELPQRKAGLWEQTVTFEGRKLPPRTMQLCVDAKTDKMLNQNTSGMSKDCSKQEITQSGGTIVMDSVCNFPTGGTTTSHAVITGSFDSAYTIKTSSTREGGPQMPGSTPGKPTQMTVEAKWLGPCKADQQPGDVIMANGMKTNVLNGPAAPGVPARR